MSVEDFYEEFESYRAEVAPPWPHRIRGVVVDPAGNPSIGAWVAANRGEGRWEDTARTSDTGAFELVVDDGRYYLNVDLTTTGCVVPTDDRQYPGGDRGRGRGRHRRRDPPPRRFVVPGDVSACHRTSREDGVLPQTGNGGVAPPLIATSVTIRCPRRKQARILPAVWGLNSAALERFLLRGPPCS